MKAGSKTEWRGTNSKHESRKLVLVLEYSADVNSYFLPETPCVSECIWYNFTDPGELIFEEMTEQRILCSQNKWKKPIDSVSLCCQMVKSIVAKTWIYSLCCPHQLDNSNIFESSFLCSHTT